MERTQTGIVTTPSLRNLLKSKWLDLRAKSVRPTGPTVEDRQQALIIFYQEYETLVETICDSAQYGPTPHLERKYQAQRQWMISNYGLVRRYVIAYLRMHIEDDGDAFEALFIMESLELLLQSDDGNMISRIMRTREALNLYGDHLRQLALAA